MREQLLLRKKKFVSLETIDNYGSNADISNQDVSDTYHYENQFHTSIKMTCERPTNIGAGLMMGNKPQIIISTTSAAI